MTSCDVAVVGGGPAGAVAARHLAEAGLETVLLEAKTLPRYKTCGGGLVARARNWIGVDIHSAVERECHAAEMRFAGRASHEATAFRIERAEPLVTMTMRADLDLALVAAAEIAGARAIAPCRVTGLEYRTYKVAGTSRGSGVTAVENGSGKANGVCLETEIGAVRARYVIAADGAAGRTAVLAGFTGRGQAPRRIPALESEIRVPSEQFHRFSAARFDFGDVPRGYAWVFPKREHLSVGCLSFEPGGKALKARLDGYLERLGIRPVSPTDREDHGFTIPVAPISGRGRDFTRERVLLTGDAAGLADPVTCEGISFAALSGRLAAEAIAANPGSPERVARAYAASLRREILGELKAARLLSRVLYGSPGLRRRLFRHAGQELCEAMGEVLSGRETYRSLLGSPRNHLRLLGRMIRRPPAPASPTPSSPPDKASSRSPRR